MKKPLKRKKPVKKTSSKKKSVTKKKVIPTKPPRSLATLDKIVRAENVRLTAERKEKRDKAIERTREQVRKWLKTAIKVDPDTGETRHFNKDERNAMLKMSPIAGRLRFQKKDVIELVENEDGVKRIYSYTTKKYYSPEKYDKIVKLRKYHQTVAGVSEFYGMDYQEARLWTGKVMKDLKVLNNRRAKTRRALRAAKNDPMLKGVLVDQLTILNEKIKELNAELGRQSY